MWDANGNLLSDGEQSYTYTHANRPTTLVAAGVTTHYVLDLNLGLIQVLQENEVTYLYGLERISRQCDGKVGYFLGATAGNPVA